MAYVGKKPADIIATAVDTTTGTFSGDLTVDTSTLYVDSANNRVGVGTVSPSKPLHVFNSGTSYVQISGNSRDLFLGQDATGGAIFSTGAVPMYFSTNSTERMRIDSSGNVGIGTSSPSAKLQVEGTLTVRSSSSQIFNDSANANNLTMNDSKVHFNIDGADKDFQVSSDTITNALFVQGSSGNVGIGTASPSTKLDIAGNIAQTQTTQNIEFNQTNNAGTFSFKNRADISRAFISTNSTPMTLNVESADYLNFGTSNTERMRIDSAGNVGIGLSSPQELLHLKDGSIAVGNGTASNNTVIGRIGFSTDSSNSRFIGIESFRGSDAANADLRFHTFGGDGDNGERMRITNSGVVSINSSSPISYANSQATLFIEDSINPSIALSDTGQSKDYFIAALGTQLSIRYADGGGSSNATNITELIKMDNSGAVTMPNQPAFSANLGASSQTNIAVGSDITVEFDNEIFDQNSDYNNSTYTFTAPVTGRYQFNIVYYLENIDTASGYYYIYFDTSNRNYFNIFSPAFTADTSYLSLTLSVLADMDAGDAAFCKIRQSHGTSQTDINANSYFSGYLVA